MSAHITKQAAQQQAGSPSRPIGGLLLMAVCLVVGGARSVGWAGWAATTLPATQPAAVGAGVSRSGSAVPATAPVAPPATSPGKPSTQPAIPTSIFVDEPGADPIPGAKPKTAGNPAVAASPDTVKVLPTTAPSEPDTPAGALVLTTGESPSEAFDRLYGARLEKANEQASRIAAANLCLRILNDALQLPPSPMQYFMIGKVYEIGMRMHTPAGYTVALYSLNDRQRLYPEDKPEIDLKLLDIYETASKTPHVNLPLVARLYVAKCNELAAQKLEKKDYDGAIVLYQRCIRAERMLSKEEAYQTAELIRSIKNRDNYSRKIKALTDSLEHSPDPKIATELVKTVLLDGGDISAADPALPLVDSDLRQVASSMSFGIPQLSILQAKEVGDWYKENWNSATTGKAQSLVHAREAYQQALSLNPQHDVVWLELKASLEDVEIAEQRLAQVSTRKANNDKIRDTHLNVKDTVHLRN